MTPKDEAFALFQKIRMIQLRVRLIGKAEHSDFNAMIKLMSRGAKLRIDYGRETVEAWRQEWLKTWSDKG